MTHSSTKHRISGRVGRSTARRLLCHIAREIGGRARKDAGGLRIPVAGDFFERGRPWAVPLTDEEREAMKSLRVDPVPEDRTLYLWAWIGEIRRNGHLDGYRLNIELGHASGTLRHRMSKEPPEIDFPVVETRTGYFDSGELRSAVSRARALCEERLG